MVRFALSQVSDRNLLSGCDRITFNRFQLVFDTWITNSNRKRRWEAVNQKYRLKILARWLNYSLATALDLWRQQCIRRKKMSQLGGVLARHFEALTQRTAFGIWKAEGRRHHVRDEVERVESADSEVEQQQPAVSEVDGERDGDGVAARNAEQGRALSVPMQGATEKRMGVRAVPEDAALDAAPMDIVSEEDEREWTEHDDSDAVASGERQWTDHDDDDSDGELAKGQADLPQSAAGILQRGGQHDTAPLHEHQNHSSGADLATNAGSSIQSTALPPASAERVTRIEVASSAASWGPELDQDEGAGSAHAHAQPASRREIRQILGRDSAHRRADSKPLSLNAEATLGFASSSRSSSALAAASDKVPRKVESSLRSRPKHNARRRELQGSSGSSRSESRLATGRQKLSGSEYDSTLSSMQDDSSASASVLSSAQAASEARPHRRRQQAVTAGTRAKVSEEERATIEEQWAGLSEEGKRETMMRAITWCPSSSSSCSCTLPVT
eukprot:1683995-Rhodomonas_salina.3